jgi:hypothetical protein
MVSMVQKCAFRSYKCYSFQFDDYLSTPCVIIALLLFNETARILPLPFTVLFGRPHFPKVVYRNEMLHFCINYDLAAHNSPAVAKSTINLLFLYFLQVINSRQVIL